MKNYIKTLAVTAVVFYALVSFVSWSFTTLAHCPMMGRVMFLIVVGFTSLMAEAMLDSEREKAKSFHGRRA